MSPPLKGIEVTYQFGVEGVPHRDADTVVPRMANRWQAADQIQILYLPDLDFDSLIISER